MANPIELSQFGGFINVSVGASTLNITGDLTISGVTTSTAVTGYDYLRALHSPTVVTYNVHVDPKTSNHRYNGSGSELAYYIDGIESPFITFTPGRTYRFDQSEGSNTTHPIAFYLEADKTTQYSTNVTTVGTAGNPGAYTQITVGDQTPAVLHYQCVNHAYMGNSAYMNSNVVNSNYPAILSKGLDLRGLLLENINIITNTTSNSPNIDLVNGMVHLFTTQETAVSTPNIRYDASNSLDSKMNIGESVAVVIIKTASTAGYSANITIDGAAVVEKWLGGVAPSVGGATGSYDVYSFNIIKTSSATFLVLGNVGNYL